MKIGFPLAGWPMASAAEGSRNNTMPFGWKTQMTPLAPTSTGTEEPMLSRRGERCDDRALEFAALVGQPPADGNQDSPRLAL